MRADLSKERESVLLQAKLDSQADMDRLRADVAKLEAKLSAAEKNLHDTERALKREREERRVSSSIKSIAWRQSELALLPMLSKN